MFKYGCPTSGCTYGKSLTDFIKNGKYFRQNDSRYIQKYKCPKCGKTFSKAIFDLEYRQKKRRINFPLLNMLCSGISMRRAAKRLKVDKKTVARRLCYLAKKARMSHESYLMQLKSKKVRELQFDDLISIEHTKLKPLSITLSVEKHTRKILGVEVSSMPAFGHLAKRAVKKYGPRLDGRKEGIDILLHRIKHIIKENCQIETDEHRLYPPAIRKHFPKAKHIYYKGGRSCIAGQGELKKKVFDPLFSLNHTCAMLRANINRLFRRTWCTTKLQVKLKEHLDIYLHFHNCYLL